MSLRDELLIPLRGIADARRDLVAGTLVLCRCGVRLLVKALRAAFSGQAGESAGRSASLADGAERLAGGVLVVVVAGVVVVTVLSGIVPRLAPYLPVVTAVGVPGWAVAAWIAAPPRAPRKGTPAPRAEAPAGFPQWLLQTIGDRPGIHLRELYPAMRRLPGQEDRTDPQLRAALGALGVPVTRSLRVGGVAGRSGVRRVDVLGLPSPAGEPGVEAGGDAGQGQVSPPLSVIGEGL